ncbi:hypothetical protein FGB62_255g03 [Gracilaria domingensis]|nr:hypothetical protein FGB62_255g03 [Gracilaria domingensis]
MRNDETGFMEKACQGIIEDIVAKNLMRKTLRRQRYQTASTESYLNSRNERKSVIRTFEKELSTSDMVWKYDGVLSVANATVQSSGSKQVAGVETFINQLCVPEEYKKDCASWRKRYVQYAERGGAIDDKEAEKFGCCCLGNAEGLRHRHIWDYPSRGNTSLKVPSCKSSSTCCDVEGYADGDIALNRGAIQRGSTRHEQSQLAR